jgi:autotransporter-associated beta strand protein
MGTVQGEMAGAKTLTLQGSSASSLVNTVGPIHDGAGTVSVIKADANTWAINGGSTYTGITTISGGTLSVSAENNLGGNPGTPNAAQLTLNGGTLATTATMTIDDSSRGITVGSSGGTINTATGTTLTVANTNSITTTGNLTKSGDGTLLVNGLARVQAALSP